MKWQRGNDLYIESDTGYRICKVWVATVLWYVSWSPEPREFLGKSLNSAAAKELCEYHYAASQIDAKHKDKVKFHTTQIKQELDS